MLNYSPEKINNDGLITCCRYSFPPNSLSLCGPDQKSNLAYYASSGNSDLGTKEILTQFSTLYPYLTLIARANSLSDPFDFRVVEAYWLGNSLLNKVTKSVFVAHLTDNLGIDRKIGKKEIRGLLNKFNFNPLPNHSFHVLNIYKRTGHIDLPHTVYTMDACLINYGRVTEIYPDKMKIKTQRLKLNHDKLEWENNIEKTIRFQGIKDFEAKKLKKGDYITYHWGIFCRKITGRQKLNLNYFNNLALRLANLGDSPQPGTVPPFTT